MSISPYEEHEVQSFGSLPAQPKIADPGIPIVPSMYAPKRPRLRDTPDLVLHYQLLAAAFHEVCDRLHGEVEFVPLTPAIIERHKNRQLTISETGVRRES